MISENLIYFFTSCILRAYYMPFTLLGSEDTLVSNHYRKTVTQTETTLPPNSCEILPPNGFSRPLNILWYKNNFILHVNIVRTRENHWYHKPTLEVKYTIRMRTLSCRLLNGYSPLSLLVSGYVYQSVVTRVFSVDPVGRAIDLAAIDLIALGWAIPVYTADAPESPCRSVTSGFYKPLQSVSHTLGQLSGVAEVRFCLGQTLQL